MFEHDGSRIVGVFAHDEEGFTFKAYLIGEQDHRVVVNGGNGCAGPILAILAGELPIQLVQIQSEPDGTFPNGVPNPLLPENREVTGRAVREQGAALGLAWDGDFDRCFFFDESGGFIDGYYLVGFLAQAVLAREPGAKIVHDPRLVWNTRELVAAAGGIPVLSKAGHSFIKERMRAENGAYGGEMSAHHYFREFSYCDSGMIPWLLVLRILGRAAQPISELVRDRIAAYPISGEINSKVADPDGVLQRIEAVFGPQAQAIDLTDGVSMEFAAWRFNVRKSNTEPVVRLNVEARGDAALVAARTTEMLQFIRG